MEIDNFTERDFLLRITQGVFGILFILAGLGSFQDSIIGSLAISLTGLFLIPQLRDKLSEAIDYEFSWKAVAGVVIVGFLIFGATMPSDNPEPENTPNENVENPPQNNTDSQPSETENKTEDTESNQNQEETSSPTSEIFTLPAPQDVVELETSSNGIYTAAITDSGNIQRYDSTIPTGESWAINDVTGTAIELNTDGSKVAGIWSNGGIGVYTKDRAEWKWQVSDAWDISGSSDLSTVAAIQKPSAGTGRLTLFQDGTESWDKSLSEMSPEVVDVTSDGSKIAVGGGQYYTGGTDYQGQHKAVVYNSEGDELWSKTYDSRVIDIDINQEQDTVAVGTDDGKLFVYDLEGNSQWSKDSLGGYLAMADNTGQILTSEPDRTVLLNSDGSKAWSYNGTSVGRKSVISADGSLSLTTGIGDMNVVALQDGEEVFSQEYEQAVSVAVDSDGSRFFIGSGSEVTGYELQ